MTEAIATPDAGAELVAAIEAPALAAPEAPSPGRSQDDKIRDALNAVGALDEAPDAPLKKPNVADQERNEGGQFKAKEPKPEAEKPEADKPAPKAEKAEPEPAPDAKVQPAPDAKSKIAAPDRFNDGAKAEWDAAPDAVKHEVTRMQRELEKGLSEYKTKAAEIEARDAPLKPFREMAEKAGVPLDAALKSYVAAEQALAQNPVAALAQMADQYVPGGFQAFVAQLTGQQQGQPDPRDAQIMQLQQQVAQLSRGFQQTAQTLEEQQAVQVRSERQAMVDQFAAAHPRAQEPEVEAEMIRLLSSGYIAADLPPQDRLSQAYSTATRLIPAPEAQPAPPAAPAQTRPAATSISGAPASGSSPRASAPKSQEEAVNAALSRYGII